jgi:predicted transcriptional regulator
MDKQTGKVETFTSATGHKKTDTQSESLAAVKKSGLTNQQAYEVALLLSDGIPQTSREIEKQTGIERCNINQAVNRMTKQRIIPIATKTKCKTTKRTVSNYTLSEELLNINSVSVLRFCNELDRLLKTPIYNLPKLIFEELKRQGITCRKTTDRTVLAIVECNQTEYITQELSAAKIAEIEADGVQVIECFNYDTFFELFVEEKL